MTGIQHVTVSPLSHDAPLPLVEQITGFLRTRIDERHLRAGTRMPSIRRFAEDNGVSRFTVVEAYDRLVAQGYLESRRGSGFYVRERPQPVRRAERREPPATRIDGFWLLQHLYAGNDGRDVLLAGSGCLPEGWLEEEMLQAGLRALARREPSALTGYGTPRGYAPLRDLLQVHLAELEINAQSDNIVLTAGASGALDLVARYFLQPGDTVLVDDPGYYVLFGRLALMGIRPIGVPRTADGLDLERLDALATEHAPKLFMTNSVLHNPTGTSLSAANAHRILRLAEAHDFHIVEDDILADLHPGRAHRIAALDQLHRVIYVGSFSKTLGAGLRVGFLAAHPDLARDLTAQKMLATLTTPELGERLVYQVLSDGYYRKHVDHLRGRVGRALEQAIRNLERAGLKLFHEPTGGMFLWAHAGEQRDGETLAAAAEQQGIILAPGSLFSPSQMRSPWMRFHVAYAGSPRLAKFFEALK
ncbi:MAG TPA: PLP-dependent aminotransferase family protein [Burkholderiales bacterium]|nr:PLP-dependent aminotransferase family protein [Burkholderiales bacterium]